MAHAPGHPLTEGKRPYEFQHRVVFYDTNGVGPFECHWCGVEVDFSNMHIDHHDNDKTNNTPGNLLPSCPHCNMNRPRRERYLRFRDAFRKTIVDDDGVSEAILAQLTDRTTGRLQ
ncbi:HNH endonuclease [Rhizobium leguminosarum bv. viciae]|uniref:HNH endonuclease n=1 Tax=Rhizobium leguminosarum bv. viciae TaxID=387 RepID=A0A7G6RL54_RHILV|nr:HNH endonuclease [Rhizobium leguminosarum bv. viciae]